MDSWADNAGPPRKKMRKGTKSCLECRRRKIRCTYDNDRHDVCHECHLRGSKCVDQENGLEESNTLQGPPSGERYSLRERVAYLETIVGSLAQKLDQTNAILSKSGQTTAGTLTPTSSEPDRLGPSSENIENAPVLQLFDNYLVSRRKDPSTNDQFTGARDTSPKARAARAELITFFPSENDIQTILSQCSHMWCIWEDDIPGIKKTLAAKHAGAESQLAPADIAKALVCLSLTVLQSPVEFDLNKLETPIDPQEFASRCCEAVDRLVVRDDDFSATLPGIECHVLLSKFHMNEGRLRKAWLVNRRAIELAHLAGMHLSTRNPRPSDVLFERRLKIWCSLGNTDRSISLILGLPYVVADAFFIPQVERRLKLPVSTAEEYMLRIGVICGHMIDRNQNPGDMSLESTLKLDQELMDTWEAMPNSTLGTDPAPGEKREHYFERVPLQLMPNVLRALLHLPFILKYPYDVRFAYSHKVAIQAARNSLGLYKIIRSTARSYLCKTIDFLAFTMGMLLILYLHGYSEESPDCSSEENNQDWELIEGLVSILRQAANENGGSVAAESAHILGEIYRSRSEKENWHLCNSCEITVPYFGTITVGLGTKFSGAANKASQGKMPSTSKQSPGQIYTPPLSDLDGGYATQGKTTNDHTPIFETPSHTNPPLSSSGDGTAGSFAGMEGTAFSGLFDDIGQYMWPTPGVDLGLDQGWNLNWFELQ
ncbi:hypothetical protein N7478_000626 [Penicillium angulare]|uniref:uncharacterized protein n=1 Tax=Penicillium angulare TaxID=116970 RepID=UPI002540FE95|nr:uncharacterized protein N7478_000626 [Penicillium angulare]KAJ5291375.1 hypothetical protein N7478_000626 [Penicillium angulare]